MNKELVKLTVDELLFNSLMDYSLRHKDKEMFKALNEGTYKVVVAEKPQPTSTEKFTEQVFSEHGGGYIGEVIMDIYGRCYTFRAVVEMLEHLYLTDKISNVDEVRFIYGKLEDLYKEEER